MAEKNVRFSIIAKDKTAAAFKAVRSGLKSVTGQVFTLTAGLGALAGVGGFTIMAKNAMDSADKIHKLNIRLGASTEALSQYRHVATMSGVTFQTFTMGLQRMTRRVSEAANGTGEAVKALEELNMDAAQLSQLAPEAQFEALADALSKVEDPASRVRLAMKLFDSGGVSLLQMMEGGAAGLQKMREEADALGMTMSKDMVTSVATANDSLAKVGEQIMGVVESIVGAASPAIAEIADMFRDWVSANYELIDTKLIDWFESLTNSSGGLTEKLSGVFAIGKAVFEIFSFIANLFADLAKWIGETTAKLAIFIEKLNAIPFGLLGTGDVWSDEEAVANIASAGGGASPGAAALAAAGGGSGFTGTESDLWNWSGSGSGTTIVNNFNSQITRSDAVAIASEADRVASRQ
jgi:hypothetical protein